MKKHGFSMIELLFAMIIMAALAAIAIPSLKSGTDSASYTALRSDTANFLSIAQADYANELTFVASDGGSDGFTDTDDDGIADTGGLDGDGKINGKNVTVSKGTVIYSTPTDCNGDGDINGITLSVANANLPRYVYYSSCTSGKFTMVDK